LVNMISPSSIVQVGFMVTAIRCHGVPVRGAWRQTASSVGGQPRHWLQPVSCDALPADSTTVLPEPLRFLPLHSQADESADSSSASAPIDTASDPLEVPALPVLPCEATPASSAHNVNTWSRILGVTAEPTSITLDDICGAQSLDDNLQPVIQCLSGDEKPLQGSQPDCPEEARVLFGRWASVVPVDGTPYCHFSDPAGPLHALVLPSASQVRERFQQAKAFVRQQAGRGISRQRLCHSVSIEPPNTEVDRQTFLHHAGIGDERPLNNKCPNVVENQSTKQVNENVTEGTNTHCVDSSSHSDSVDRHTPMILAADDSGGYEAGAGAPTPPVGWVRWTASRACLCRPRWADGPRRASR